MRFSILSMQKVNNFGSLLQAYALQKLLAPYADEVCFVDIKRQSEDNKLLDGKTALSVESEKKKSSNKLMQKLSLIDRYFFNRFKIKKISCAQNVVFDNFRKEVLNIKDSDNDLHYDLCVIGSDEVFNCASKSEWGFTSQLFGNVDGADNVITYAASCGATKYENILPSMAEVIKKSFDNLLAISVRDENTREFCKKITSKEIDNHLDPVLVGDFSEEMASTEPLQCLPKKYCIVYSYYNRIHKKEEINAIKRFCRKKNLQIIAIGAPQKWIKNYPVLSPFETLVAFRDAEFIITDTFHGTIFAAKYNGKFATMLRESNKNKLGDLINRIKTHEHTVSSFDELEKAWNAPDTVQIVNEICDIEKQNTINYFDECIRHIKEKEN